MCADLVRRAVVDAQRERAAADIEAQRLPGEGLLKDALAKITGEEEAIAAPRSQGGEEPCLSHAKILRLIDHCKIVRPSATLGESIRQPTEDIRPRHSAAVSQPRTDTFEDGPKGLALLAADPGFSPEARHVAVILPRPKLPSVHDVVPFSDQELRREPVPLDLGRCLIDQRLDQRAWGDLGLSETLGMKVIPYGRDRPDDDPCRNRGLVAREAGQFGSEGIRQRFRECWPGRRRW